MSKKKKPEFKRTAICAEVAVISGDLGSEEILLIKRAHDPFIGCWGLPGGFAEFGEDVKAAGARELLEETGMQASWLHEAGIHMEQIDEDFRQIHLFIVRNGVSQMADWEMSDETLDIQRFRLTKLPINTIPGFDQRVYYITKWLVR